MIPIIAEPGSTADGDLGQMSRLLDAATDADCTHFKPQWTSDPGQLCARRHAPSYREAYQRIAYPLAWHEELSRATRQRGMGYVVTVYLPEDAARVAPYVDAIKIASFEASDATMLRAAAATGRPLYISTGMATLAEAVTASASAALLLHCTSAYVAPLESLNLGAIRTLQRHVGCPVGYSDHSARETTGALAVAAGAAALEVHYRLADCDPANADYAVSLSPGQLRAYVTYAREAECAMGDGVKRPQAAEQPMQAYRVSP